MSIEGFIQNVQFGREKEIYNEHLWEKGAHYI